MKIDEQTVARSACLFIVSGPSGAGKTSICTPALARLEGLELGVSVTTRRPRSGETDGVEYRFVSEAQFAAMAERGEFPEWAQVHGHRYGTARAAIERALANGHDLRKDAVADLLRAMKARLRTLRFDAWSRQVSIDNAADIGVSPAGWI